MFPFDSILQAALLTFFVIIVFLLFIFSLLLAASTRKKVKTIVSALDDDRIFSGSDEKSVETEELRSGTDTYWEEKNQAEQERKQREENERLERERLKREEEDRIRPIYEKYPQIYRFEILYWRAVSKPWWWNNYAKELVEYANEYFPWNKVDYYSSYNSNSKGEDYNYPPFHDRIVRLRPHKLSKHPLVVINYDEEYIMVDSYYALEEMMDRIDAEWYRHYQFKKTYRHSPLTYRR